MKRSSARCTSLAVAFAIALAGGFAWGAIEGSKHDFSHAEWSDGDACGACHTPNRTAPPDAAPLWDPTADLSRRFGAPLGEDNKIGLGTALCLRCHDGTIATASLGGVRSDRFANKQNPAMFTTGHDTTDHPVGVEYPQFDRGFRPITSVLATGTVTLPNGKVDCVSCHDPHDQTGQPHMLVMGNARSALCLTCHRK